MIGVPGWNGETATPLRHRARRWRRGDDTLRATMTMIRLALPVPPIALSVPEPRRLSGTCKADASQARGATVYRRIIVPLDGSELAEQALPQAEALARLTGAPLHLVRVIDPAGLGPLGNVVRHTDALAMQLVL